MSFIKPFRIIGLFLFLFVCATVHAAADCESRLLDLQERWAHADYRLQGDQQRAALKKLQGKVNALQRACPKRAEVLILKGMVLSSYANAMGGMQGLEIIHQARDALDTAIAINPTALEGSAYARLGVIYARVPE